MELYEMARSKQLLELLAPLGVVDCWQNYLGHLGHEAVTVRLWSGKAITVDVPFTKMVTSDDPPIVFLAKRIKKVLDPDAPAEPPAGPTRYVDLES